MLSVEGAVRGLREKLEDYFTTIEPLISPPLTAYHPFFWVYPIY